MEKRNLAIDILNEDPHLEHEENRPISKHLK